MTTQTTDRDCGACRMFANLAAQTGKENTAICGVCFDEGLAPIPAGRPAMTTKTTTTRPKGAKAPADHQPKATEQDGDRTVTVAGRDWTVPADALDDFELLDDLGALEDGNAARLPRIMRRLLGDDYKAALDAIRDESGVVRIEPAGKFIEELLKGLDPN